MPELEWQLGYPLAIVLMLIAAACHVFFKWKNWLLILPLSASVISAAEGAESGAN